MSQATRAKTAKERATIAIRKLKTVKQFGRSFDDCFEMGDGEEVRKIIVQKAWTDSKLLERCLQIFVWPELRTPIYGPSMYLPEDK